VFLFCRCYSDYAVEESHLLDEYLIYYFLLKGEKTMAKNYVIEVSVSKAEFEAIANCKPSYKRGNDEGSFNACKKACGYAFEKIANDGKAKFNRIAYDRGCFLFMEKYGSLLKDANFPADKPTEEKPTSTSRGKNKGAKISENDEELFKQFLAFKKMMENNK
jgi:hypothetical protein